MASPHYNRLLLLASRARCRAAGSRATPFRSASSLSGVSHRQPSSLASTSEDRRRRRPLTDGSMASDLPSRGLSSHIRLFSSSPGTDGEGGATASAADETLEFQAETRQLLDIVTHSLYTDKEVFLRELVSNASDALEKLRHVQTTGGGDSGITDPDAPLEIRIETDEASNTLTISDTGIGMTREDMVSNLGTIARSGSRAFMQEMAAKGQTGGTGGADVDLDPSGQGIIGKFGVGFYSAFMVASKVEVRSKPAVAPATSDDTAASQPMVWASDGTGKYTLSPLASDVRQDRGSSVVIHLKDDDVEYSDEKTIESVLKRYSNFVSFPIYLNGKRVNTMEAIWLKEPKSVDEKTHSAFYKYVSGMYDEPLSTIHFRMDAPLSINALFYIPSFHQEKYGAGRMDPGVSIYCRKIAVERNSPDILPEWCRFVKGVVDSEDLPLSISREKTQDTKLIDKMRKVLTRKIISHLTTMARKDPDTYRDEFYREYAFFLKEGVCQDFESSAALSKLLRFETSKGLAGEMSSLDEYVSRSPPEQKDIYYLCAPNRELALQSPYMEGFDKAGREVVFVYTAIDDFVMANLKKYEDRELVGADRSGIDLGGGDGKKDGDEKKVEGEDEEGDESGAAGKTKLTDSQAAQFCSWFRSALPDKVAHCKTTDRLASSPAVITDGESGAVRRMMRMVETQDGGLSPTEMPLPKQTLEVNPNHEIIVGLNELRNSDPTLAKVLAEQILDNCLVAAGLLDDGRTMLPRLNDLMLCIIKGNVVPSAKDEEKKEEK